MDINLFDFMLPDSAIAVRPARPRHASRLLHVPCFSHRDVSESNGTDEDISECRDARDAFGDYHFSDLADLLNPGDCLVVNNTKVIPARLFGKRGEASLEVTLHLQTGPTSWKVFAKPARKCRLGDDLIFGSLSAKVTEVGERGERELVFDIPASHMMSALIREGSVPLPPYIQSKRALDDQDKEDYQTIYAVDEGAVAAPTAGLHFTDQVFKALADRGIGLETVTLHVGAGTFLPVTAKDTDDHKMHKEWGVISSETAKKLNDVRAAGGRIISVGTTSLRLLESAASIEGQIQPFEGTTDIFITPGHDFKGVDALITNFHLPKSTLFMLVSAFAGIATMKSAYHYAINQGYRFYSYGDSSLLEKAPSRSVLKELMDLTANE